jgi:PIN domain nuclease of toxin-antitoxin system
MAYLVDTNGWIGFLDGDPRFGKEAKSRMLDSPEQCFVSIASVWEAAIKVGLGKLKLPYDLEQDLPRIFEENGFSVIGLDFREVVAVRDLP